MVIKTVSIQNKKMLNVKGVREAFSRSDESLGLV
jgi:hypothetical protein